MREKKKGKKNLHEAEKEIRYRKKKDDKERDKNREKNLNRYMKWERVGERSEEINKGERDVK